MLRRRTLNLFELPFWGPSSTNALWLSAINMQLFIRIFWSMRWKLEVLCWKRNGFISRLIKQARLGAHTVNQQKPPCDTEEGYFDPLDLGFFSPHTLMCDLNQRIEFISASISPPALLHLKRLGWVLWHGVLQRGCGAFAGAWALPQSAQPYK